MGSAKPEFLYRGIIVNEKVLKEKPVYGVDLTPPNPPKYDEQGRKIVGDGNEYGVYMSDYKEVATEAYANVSINDGTPLNSNIRIGDRALRIAVPAVGIVYKISTNNLDVHKPWITSTLQGHYNNGYMGDEWIAEKIPVENYRIEKVVVGEDILHPKKEIVFENQEEILSIINEELEERKKRLINFEKFIESLPINNVLRMTTFEIDVYKEIFKKNGLIETNIDTFNVNNTNDCIKLMMAYIYKSNQEKIPMQELQYLNYFNKNQNINFSDVRKKLLTDIDDKIKSREEFIERKKISGEEINTKGFDNKIAMLSNMLKLYHNILLKQIIKITGVTFYIENSSIIDLRKLEGIYSQKLEELYYNGDLSLQLYQEMKKIIRDEIELSITNVQENKTIESNSEYHR